MITSLLTTKLFIPPARPDLVARPRLLERMQATLDNRLTLVSAPAGFGKTILISEWARESQERCRTAWLSLDEGDNDPVRFWDYFIAALKTLQPATGERALALLHSAPAAPIESVLTTLINDFTTIPENFAFILDDYHFIRSEPIHAGIAFLLDHLPPGMHLVIATREDPPLPLSHFRGRGTMLEIGADDLRFTPEEASALLKEMQAPELSIDDIKALNTRAEGWAVGLKMAALSLHQRQNAKEFIASFTGSQRYIMDYLIEEVLKRQSADAQDFLLQTSVLDRLTAPLCDYLTGRSDSQDMLSKLERANLFIVPLDESRQWYRYHHLFAELLRHRLEMAPGTKEVPLRHQRASRWYEENNFPDDAIHHALAARDWESAMRLIYAQSWARIYRAEFNTLFSWLQVIPDEILRTHPRLYGQYINVLVTVGQLEAAAAALSHLEIMAQGDAGLQGELAVHQMGLARLRGDVTRTVEFGERALALLPPDDFANRAEASFFLGLVQYYRARLDEARLLMTDAYEMGRQSGNYLNAAGGAGFLSMILGYRGRLRQALNMGQQAVELAGQSLAATVPR